MTRVAYLSGALRVTTDASASTGGPRSHVTGVIDALQRAGHEVDRYIAGDQRWASRLAGGGRDDVVRASTWRAVVADGVRVAAGVANTAAARRRMRGRYAFAYERFASFQSIGRAFQRRGVPWILETSGPFFHEARAERGTLALGSLARRVELAAYDRCDLLVCVSEALRDWLVDAGVRSEHMVVMPNAVDVARFDPARVDVATHGDELVVGFVGTVLAWQGLDTLVRGVALARSRGASVRAVVVGDGPAREGAEKLSAELGVGHAVEFTGQVAAGDVAAHIARFDLGASCHLPLLDGAMYHSPLKLYEYLAMGVPLLAADHPEARSLVAECGAGHLFPAGDVEALAATMALAANELPVLRSSRDRVRAHAVDHHSWDRRVADLLAEIERRAL